MNFREEIIKLLEQKTNLTREEIDKLLSIPPDSKLGDYAFPCFKLGANPKEAAEKLKDELERSLPKFLSKTAVAGPYLNFYLNSTFLASTTLTSIYKRAKTYGAQNLGNGRRVVIDFSSPNIAKPFGIGHLRSTVIGSCLYKVYNFLGYSTIGVNHLGDWGTQFGKLIVSYQKWGEEKKLEEDPIKYLLSLYVKFHEEAEKDDLLNDLARAEFKKLEDGNKKPIALWETFRELSLQEFKRIYHILDVEFDSFHGEAFYNNKLNQTIEEIETKLSTQISDGALIIDLKKFKMPPILLKKSDGGTTYHTRDLAAVFYRLRQYKPSKLLYVVGSEQKLHFRQLFKVLDLMGEDKELFEHVDFGLFRFAQGKMSTRKGKVIFLDEVLNKSIELAQKIIEEKNPNLKEKKNVANMVGVGAIIFADLSNERTRNINFDWDRMLSFDGETAPYLQYTHARSCSILRKVKEQHNINLTATINFDLLTLEEERNVIKKLYLFTSVLEKVVATNKPHHLAQYLIGLAQSFNEFYHKCPVISNQINHMKARILLVDCVRQVLENGLNLMGIKAPKEM